MTGNNVTPSATVPKTVFFENLGPVDSVRRPRVFVTAILSARIFNTSARFTLAASINSATITEAALASTEATSTPPLGREH
jgi:hypothetical protein